MTKSDLAKELRDGLAVDTSSFSDDEVIDLYNRCQTCQKTAIPLGDLDLIIAEVRNSDEFMARLDGIDADAFNKGHLEDCDQRL